jgi:hypothetical protein
LGNRSLIYGSLITSNQRTEEVHVRYLHILPVHKGKKLDPIKSPCKVIIVARADTCILFSFISCLNLLSSQCHILPIHTKPICSQTIVRRTFISVRYLLLRFELLVRVWFVSIVYPFVVACFFGSVCSLILAVPLYISFCVYHLPTWYMMSVHL